MNMQFPNWSGNHEITAVCWTLVHSLWTGLIAAAVAGAIITFTRRSTPQLRYRLLCTVLFVFMVTMIGILQVQLETPHQVSSEGTHFANAPVPASSLPASWVQLSGATLLSRFADFLNQQSSWIFGFWLLCFLFKSMRLIGGIFYIRRIRNRQHHPAPVEWQEKVNDLARSLGISRDVQLLQSELVKVPVTVGLLKPVILLPMGMMFQLLPGQLDTILIHELAHIYRRDYLVNILQRMVEAIFFFNPAILWISVLVREEREACCDDIVLDNVSRKRNYLEALLAFQADHSSTTSLALALSLRKNQLMARLRRMVHKENQRLNPVELGILLLGLVFLSAFTFIPEVKPGIKKGVNYIGRITHSFSEAASTEKTLLVVKPARLQSERVSPPVTLRSPDTLRQFTSFKFNGSNGDTANFEVNVTDNQGNRYFLKKAGGAFVGLAINGSAIASDKLAEHRALIHQITQSWEERRLAKSQYMIANSQLAEEKRQAMQTANAALKKKKSGFPSPAVQADNSPKPRKKMPAAPDISADLDRVRGVIAELVGARVVGSGGEVQSFGLSDDQLTVNDVKQPAELQQRLKQAYGIKPGYGLFYGPVKGGGKGIIIDKQNL